jgi:hypothetical protein
MMMIPMCLYLWAKLRRVRVLRTSVVKRFTVCVKCLMMVGR